MARIGLVFEDRTPTAASPNRADIACFLGFVRARAGGLTAAVRQPLEEQGWTDPRLGRLPLEDLLDVPVPVESWDAFQKLFAWEMRTPDGRNGSTYLGAAVRSFFAQGGRKCYVVRVGDPWPVRTPQAARAAQVARLIPGYPGSLAASPVDRGSWGGVAHLFGLPDVSFVCLPDLADALAPDAGVLEVPPEPVLSEEFVECSRRSPEPPQDRALRDVPAPRFDEAAYTSWAVAAHMVADLVARNQREVQFIAALPIPRPGSTAERNLLEFLLAGPGPLGAKLDVSTTGLSSAFVQLVFPWARSLGSTDLPEQLESPEGVLAGVLARNALARGSFRSAANLTIGDVYDLAPLLGRGQVLNGPSRRFTGPAGRYSLVERVSLFGPTPEGLRLISDVTASLDESYRPAAVNRLVSAIVRAARRLGEDSTFEPSDENLWAQLRSRMSDLLRGLFAAGALRGAGEADAFQVRCDRSTMSQNDIDAGRVIAVVQFDAAAPIDTITVVLVFGESRQVSVERSAAA